MRTAVTTQPCFFYSFSKRETSSLNEIVHPRVGGGLCVMARSTGSHIPSEAALSLKRIAYPDGQLIVVTAPEELGSNGSYRASISEDEA